MEVWIRSSIVHINCNHSVTQAVVLSVNQVTPAASSRFWSVPVSWHLVQFHSQDWRADSWQVMGFCIQKSKQNKQQQMSQSVHNIMCNVMLIRECRVYLTTFPLILLIFYWSGSMSQQSTYPVIFCDLRFWYSTSSTVHTAPFTFSTRTKHLCRLRLWRTAFWRQREITHRSEGWGKKKKRVMFIHYPSRKKMKTRKASKLIFFPCILKKFLTFTHHWFN